MKLNQTQKDIVKDLARRTGSDPELVLTIALKSTQYRYEKKNTLFVQPIKEEVAEETIESLTHRVNILQKEVLRQSKNEEKIEALTERLDSIVGNLDQRFAYYEQLRSQTSTSVGKNWKAITRLNHRLQTIEDALTKWGLSQ